MDFRSKKSRPDPANIDADDPLDDSDSDEDSDSDDEAALMAELKKIKEEKAMEMREKVSLCFNSMVSIILVLSLIHFAVRFTVRQLK